jgi:hypothetical protein
MTTETLPALADTDDGFADTDSREFTNLIVGQRVKFVKGVYIVGKDEGELTGAEVVAHSVKRALQKWHDGQLVNQIVQKPREILVSGRNHDFFTCDTCLPRPIIHS